MPVTSSLDPIYHPTRNKITSIILPRQTACERRAQIARRLDEEFGEGLRIDKDGLVVNARLARRRLHAKKHGAHALAARVGEAEEGAAPSVDPTWASALLSMLGEVDTLQKKRANLMKGQPGAPVEDGAATSRPPVRLPWKEWKAKQEADRLAAAAAAPPPAAGGAAGAAAATPKKK